MVSIDKYGMIHASNGQYTHKPGSSAALGYELGTELKSTITPPAIGNKYADSIMGMRLEGNHKHVKAQEKLQSMGYHPAVQDNVSKNVINTRSIFSAARDTLDKAERIEPEVTKDMYELADFAKGQIKGIEYKLKTHESLCRKIKSDYEEMLQDDPGATPKHAAAKISDALRYTIQVDKDDDYSKAIYQSSKELRRRGYMVAKTKNYWKVPLDQNPYQGVNLALVHEKTGQKVELQFHTKDSLEVKEGELHSIYEDWRQIPNKQSPEAKAMSARMAELAAAIPVPRHIERI